MKMRPDGSQLSYQQCTRCVMDTSAADIVFDSNGVCSYCTEFLERSSHVIFEQSHDKMVRLQGLIDSVKKAGRGKLYDCVVGVSGGVDSSWVLAEAVRLGLRPLAVHMDNGWNSELAQNNIANLVTSLGVDLHTHVIDWEEYRGLMQAFFDADVIDVELLYDNAMLAVNYAMARKYGLKYILAGTNQATEGIAIPRNWNWFKLDKRNVYSLARRAGLAKLKSFPSIGTIDYLLARVGNRVHWTSFLDYLHFNKFDALDVLEQRFGYRRYPFKHYESIFTRFYQGYILPRKFNVDKRRLHLSTLIVSGQITRSKALQGLEGIAYLSNEDMESDIKYFLKKMGWTSKDLEEYITRPEKSHDSYGSEKWFGDLINSLYRFFK